MTKACTRCHRETDQFYPHPKTKDGLQSWCKSCTNRDGRDKELKRKTNRQHYEQNKEAYKERAARAYEQIQVLVREAKDVPCVDCGIRLPPACMDLDHVRGEKQFTVGAWNCTPLPKGKTREEAVRDEIAKCEVRCANCHRLRHYGL